MRRTGISIVMLVLSSGLAAAQMALMPGGPALGVTSPLGTMGSNSAGPVGIPLGSTQLNIGGLSPAPITPLSSATTNCFGGTYGVNGAGIAGMGTTGAGMAGMGSGASNFTFDGGGTAGLSGGTPISSSSPSLTGGCTSLPPGGGSTGLASPLSTPGSPGLTTLNGGSIPLGATELDSTGLSPLVPVPGPTISSSSTMSSSSMIPSGP
jgi:hypothetical protein